MNAPARNADQLIAPIGGSLAGRGGFFTRNPE